MSRAANSVCVVTTDGAAGRAGVTVSAMTSVSLDTPMPSLLVCIHNESIACRAIEKNGVFCANLLDQSQADVSNRFAGRTGARGLEKFIGAGWSVAETGAPVLHGSVATFDCRLIHNMLVGSHHVFVGEATAISSNPEGVPLLYFDREYCTPLGLA